MWDIRWSFTLFVDNGPGDGINGMIPQTSTPRYYHFKTMLNANLAPCISIRRLRSKGLLNQVPGVPYLKSL